jgi:hypothetical protein
VAAGLVSVADSAEDLRVAKGRIHDADDTALVEDLRFWSVAEADARQDFIDNRERLAAINGRYQEATTWTSLISDELRRRRGARPVEPEK